MRPEIAETLRIDLLMVVGTILAFLLIGWIAAKVARLARSCLTLYHDRAGQLQYLPKPEQQAEGQR